MNQNDDKCRIVIAVTETTEVPRLWRAALQNVGRSEAELLALYLIDNHWHRAASLPFTREISRIGGGVADFTVKRADQLSKEAQQRIEQIVRKLAEDSGLAYAFKAVSEIDPNLRAELVADYRTVLIAPSVVSRRPIFTQLEQLNWHIELIEATEEERESE